jgi:membrane protein
VLIFNVLGQRADRRAMIAAVEDAVPGPAGAALGQLTEEILSNSSSSAANWIVTAISIVILFWGASTLFLQLRRSLNRMYNLAPRPVTVQRTLFNHLFDRLIGAAIVLGVGIAFVLLFVLSAGFGAYAGSERTLLNLAASYAINVAVFALLYKFLPQAGVRWADVLPGALITAFLYWIGNIAVGVYFFFARTAVHYGSASIVIVVLFWVYVMSMIVLFGAKFTEVYARTRGRPVKPDTSMLSIPLDQLFDE